MASWGGHTLPGTFFILFGIFYAFKFIQSYLKRWVILTCFYSLYMYYVLKIIHASEAIINILY